MKTLLQTLFTSCLIIYTSFSQNGDPTLLRMGKLDGNNIRTTFYNDGAISGFNFGFDIRGEWPKNSGQYYIGDMSFLIGLELVNTLGDTIHPVIIHRGPRRGTSDERNPLYSYFWGFNPVPGFLNPNQESVAMSNRPETWPSIWADHPEYGSNVWNGLYGANSYVGDLETYFKIDDTQDDEFNTYFLPDSSNPSMKGYGIRVFIRYIQVDHPLFKDVLFRVYDIKNEGNYDYKKVFWGNITGTMLGGDGDSGDDLSFINSNRDLVFASDADGIGNIGQKVAYIGEGLLQSPSGNSYGNYEYFPLSASPDLSVDSLLWKRFNRGIDTLNQIPQDGDHLYGTKCFSLAAGETKRVAVILTFAYDYDRLTQNFLFAKMLWNSNFDRSEIISNVNFTNLDYHKILNDVTTIRWDSKLITGTVDLLFSSDIGKSWAQVDTSQPNNGIYSWDTKNFQDCAFGQMRIIVKDDLGKPVGYNDSHYFTVNNDSENGKPFVELINMKSNSTITNDTLDLQLYIGDPENQQLETKFYYSNDNGANYSLFSDIVLNADTSIVTIPIEIGGLLNSFEAKLKVEVSDGNTLVNDISEKFSKQTPHDAVDTQFVKLLSGYVEKPYQINIVDPSKLTGDKYLITFDDTSNTGQKYFSVYDQTKGINLLVNENFKSQIENASFDGLTLFADDIETTFNSDKSGWNPNVSNNFIVNCRTIIAPDYPIGYALPNDYKIVFYNTIVDTSIADTLYPTIGPPTIYTPTAVNFKVMNLSTNQFVDFLYRKTGTIATTHSIWCKENVKNRMMRTWQITIIYMGQNVSPIEGDTLTIITNKGFSIYDTLEVSNFTVDIKDEPNKINAYNLVQNYPNPFNPITKIKYSLPQRSSVSLKIYDILGKEISTLVNEVKEMGNYEAVFDAANLSSGIYFYRIQAGNFIKTKKMILIK